MKKYDAIVAGAGIWGCTVARRLAEAGKRVLVLEKREAVGGNCRCEIVDGVEVHLYGSHIFHTGNEEVWKFVRRFTDFNEYRHEVLAKRKVSRVERVERVDVGGPAAQEWGTYHLPIGKTLVKEFFGVDLGERSLKEFLNQTIADPKSNNKTYGESIFDAFIKGYTAKQWGMSADKVDPAIIARLKVRDNYSTDYFDDPYQGIPSEGYNKMFERMLAHENIEVRRGEAFGLSTNYTNLHELKDGGKVYYSGPIDALFDYKFGALPWRSLRFETEKMETADFQGATVVNYTDYEVPWTRIHEFKHYHPEKRWREKVEVDKGGKTIIMREFPKTWEKGDEPYYPIDNEASRALLKQYQDEVEKLKRPLSTSTSSLHLIIGGRLGGYKYFDMDKSIAAALEVEI